LDDEPVFQGNRSQFDQRDATQQILPEHELQSLVAGSHHDEMQQFLDASFLDALGFNRPAAAYGADDADTEQSEMPIVPNNDTNEPSVTARQPATTYGDSGYGSLGTNSVAPDLGKLNAVEEHAVPAHCEVDILEETLEKRTVFSDAASLLQNPHVDTYITAFAKELAMSMRPEFGANCPDAVPSTLDHLLKSFAVRLGNENPDGAQRQLMYLVYRFRGSVSKCSYFVVPA
jgi:hypothetical protein